ncbi:unnamed protein product [Allacma fusca]|uniref:Tudor domain-containing protein n=1 Tax=Allacma fusca TaxID=39272 RepID=A0A8J2NJI1_9HEXA|nr:unnamed protein product [Allacma fusca]
MEEVADDPEEIPRESDAGTWDVPFNRVRSVKVSNEGLLSALNPGAGSHKKYEPAGNTDLGECEECLIVDCGKGCKRGKKALENSHENVVSKEETEPSVPPGVHAHSSGMTECGKENAYHCDRNEEVELTKTKSISASGLPPSSNLVSLNKKLAGGRGRSIRRAVVVEPGRPPSSAESGVVLQKTVIEQVAADLECATVSEATESRIQKCVADVIRDDDALAKVLTRFASPKSFDCVNGKYVRITHIYSHNLVHVIEQEVLKNEYLDLLDDVNDICKDESPLITEPEIGDMVCAPSHDGTMHRAIIQKKNTDGKFVIRFTDLGGSKDISLQELKPFSDDLFEIPLLGYDVRIRGLEDDLPLLSPQDYEANLKPWLMKQKLKITEGKSLSRMLHEAEFIGPEYNLVDRIRRFQVWEWERLFETGLKKDINIIEGRSWPPTKSFIIPLTLFPNHPAKMECSRILQGCNLTFKNIQVDRIQAESRVLKMQIDRYVEKVQASDHFPVIEETFLFRPDNSYWRRATRLDMDCIYCFDTDEAFSLKSNHESRRMPPDFLKIPILTIMCRFSGIENDTRMQNAIEGSFKHKRFRIIFIEIDEVISCFFPRSLPGSGDMMRMSC